MYYFMRQRDIKNIMFIFYLAISILYDAKLLLYYKR